MTVRAKFWVAEKKVVSQMPNQDNLSDMVTLLPVINGSEENKNFYKWTPSGKIELSILNSEAAKQFEVGKIYYVDFIPAD